MYSRPQNRDIRIPINYGGSIFGGERAQGSTPVKDYTKRRYTPPHVVKYVEETPQTGPSEEEIRVSQEDRIDEELAEQQDQKEYVSEVKQEKVEATKSIFSPLGALGTEEILLIALALIIFQSGNDPEISLILLALLFIN